MSSSGHVAVSPEENARIQRVDALAIGGEGAVEPLIDMLGDPSWTVRRAVVAALASLGDAAVAPLCRMLVERREHEGRLAAAVDALVASRGEVAASVEALASEPNPAVVSDAAQVLGRRRETGSVALLIELSGHADDNVAVAAIEALGRTGGRAAVEALIETVRRQNFFRTFPAIDVLGRSGDPRVVEPLTVLLANPLYGTEAARALGRTGDRHAVRPLSALLEGRGEAAARVAAATLNDLAQRWVSRGGARRAIDSALREAAPRGAVRTLAQALATAEVDEQVAICNVLGVLGGDGAVAALTRLLDGPAPVAKAAGEALGRLDDQAEAQLLQSLIEGGSARRLVLLPLFSRASATDAVLHCLEDPDAEVRAAACDALARLANPLAVTALFRLLADANPRVVQAAVGAIQSLGSDNTQRLALEAAGSGWPSVRRAALRILSYFGYAAALPLFVTALRDADPRVRDAAVQGLPFIDHPGALEELVQAARDPAERLRAGAMRSLGQCRGDARVVATLLRGVADAEAWVRYYACQSLGRLGVEAASSAMARLLNDSAGQVRVAAIEALSHLRSEVAFEGLRAAAGSADPDMQRAALVGLGISRRPEAEPILLRAVSSPDAATRLVAVSAIADLDSPEVLQALLVAGADDDAGVRNAAIGFLAGRSGEAATESLVSLLPNADDRERLIAALSLPSAGRLPALQKALEAADDELAQHLTSALARMRAPEADRALVEALQSPNVAARKAVAFAVANLGGGGQAALRRASELDADPEVRRIATLLLAS